MVEARCAWLEHRGLASWRGALDELVAQCDNPFGDVWVLADEERLTRYNRTQGFALVREEQRTHARLYMMARRAERLDLSSWFGVRAGTP